MRFIFIIIHDKVANSCTKPSINNAKKNFFFVENVNIHFIRHISILKCHDKYKNLYTKMLIKGLFIEL